MTVTCTGVVGAGLVQAVLAQQRDQPPFDVAEP